MTFSDNCSISKLQTFASKLLMKASISSELMLFTGWNRQSFVKLTCSHSLHIAAWALGMEIVPGKEVVNKTPGSLSSCWAI